MHGRVVLCHTACCGRHSAWPGLAGVVRLINNPLINNPLAEHALDEQDTEQASMELDCIQHHANRAISDVWALSGVPSPAREVPYPARLSRLAIRGLAEGPPAIIMGSAAQFELEHCHCGDSAAESGLCSWLVASSAPLMSAILPRNQPTWVVGLLYVSAICRECRECNGGSAPV